MQCDHQVVDREQRSHAQGILGIDPQRVVVIKDGLHRDERVVVRRAVVVPEDQAQVKRRGSSITSDRSAPVSMRQTWPQKKKKKGGKDGKRRKKKEKDKREKEEHDTAWGCSMEPRSTVEIKPKPRIPRIDIIPGRLEQPDRVVGIPWCRGRRQMRGVRANPGIKRRVIFARLQDLVDPGQAGVPQHARSIVIGGRPGLHRSGVVDPRAVEEGVGAHDQLPIEPGRHRGVGPGVTSHAQHRIASTRSACHGA